MRRDALSRALRTRVAEQGLHRCGYCQTQELIVGMPMEIEHIIPLAAGGTSEEDNLRLACPRCNLHKADRTHVLDPLTKELVPLYDPRRQVWEKHFSWQ